MELETITLCELRVRRAMDNPEYRPPTKHAKINFAIIRCLRDTGDGDYIAARLAARHRLVPQFLWSAEQALEKYLKGILTLHRVSALSIGHDISKALRLIKEELDFEIPLTLRQKEVFEAIAEWDSDRYFLNHVGVMGHELHYLDQMVWRIRQYCQPLDVIHYADEPSRTVLEQNIKIIQAREFIALRTADLAGGRLEKILGDKTDPARPALVWNNLMFSTSTRKKVIRRNHMQMSNAPLWLEPDLIDDIAKLLKVPKLLQEEYRQLAKRRTLERD
jgi:HEPN domain-containing protein